ncbi:hypothetical protein FB451DRAFT_1396261 [Mycena latifolia]|nr:hypothetical protein FB451DRAFT_1396261 [Mycena latifolia]
MARHTDSEIRSQRSIILWNLASHRSTAICEKLMTLSRDTNVADNVAEEAFDVLSDIAISPDGAEAAVAANVLDYVAEHLISPESPQRRSEALAALSSITSSPEGAKSAVAANVLDHVPKWLAIGPPEGRRSAYIMLQRLAQHECTAAAVLDMRPCELLVTRLSNRDSNAKDALDALISIASSEDGAEATVTAVLTPGAKTGAPDRQVRPTHVAGICL